MAICFDKKQEHAAEFLKHLKAMHWIQLVVQRVKIRATVLKTVLK
jgi:hypothetical protein